MANAASDMPVLMYGIGATKAGTSWLYQYLSGHPECAMTYPKELHYFDVLDFPHETHQIRNMHTKLRALRAKLRKMPEQDVIQRAELAQNIAALAAYLPVLSAREDRTDTYVDVLMRDVQDKAVVGDITPAYGLVSVPRLIQMAQAAPDTRFVYLMRDPVDRAWSNIRMTAKRRAAAEEGDIAAYAHQMIRDMVDGGEPGLSRRSDYAGTLARIEAALPADQVFIAFYENLFTETTIRALCAFLGIAYYPPAFDKRVHAGVPIDLDAASRDTLRGLMAPQYAAVAARYAHLPAQWQQNMVKT